MSDLINGSFIFLQIYPPPDLRLCIQHLDIESSQIPVILEASIIEEYVLIIFPVLSY